MRILLIGGNGFIGPGVVSRLQRLGHEIRRTGNLQQHWLPDTTRIRRELGYREEAPLEEALKTTIVWERANPPQTIEPKLFDYAAEDACLEALV